MANAADMPLKSPPRVVSDWTGFYFGVHGGYGWAQPKISDTDLNKSNPNDVNQFGANPNDLPLGVPKPKGGVFGVHAGYNWQWAQQGVVGIEVDYSGAHINQTQATTIHFDGEQVGNIFIPGEDDTRTLKAKLDHLASARA